MHVAGYLAVVFLVLSPVKAVVFIVVQQGLFGFYLGCSFAPNHKGMPVLSAADRTGFLHRQVLTSRNVRGGWLTDFALGGLNYQIEHHLFPSMPRPNLRRSQPLIAAFCTEHGLPYTEASLLGSYAQALRHLHAVGRLARPAPPQDHAGARPALSPALGDQPAPVSWRGRPRLPYLGSPPAGSRRPSSAVLPGIGPNAALGCRRGSAACWGGWPVAGHAAWAWVARGSAGCGRRVRWRSGAVGVAGDVQPH